MTRRSCTTKSFGLLIAVIVGCTSAPKPSPSPVPTAGSAASISPAPSTSSSADEVTGDVVAVGCFTPNLMVRKEMMPRTKEFDLGADAFDLATKQYGQKLYGDAAHGFLAASEHFAKAGAEDNWRWSVQNAGYAFEQAGRADEGRKSLEALALRDAPHAAELRAIAGKLSDTAACP